MAVTHIKFKFARTHLVHERNVLQSKGLPQGKCYVYVVSRGTGKEYKRKDLRGQEKVERIGVIAGRNGEWYVVRFRQEIDGYGVVSGPHTTRSEAASLVKKQQPKRAPTRKYYGVRRGYGDDLYSWEVYSKQSGRTIVDGESRQQAGYYADKFEQEKLSAEQRACSKHKKG